MSIFHQKKLVFALIGLALLGGVYFVAAWKQLKKREPNIPRPTPSEPAANPTTPTSETISIPMPNRWQTPTYHVNEIVSSTPSTQEAGYKTIVNNYCHSTYDIPADWSVFGFLGESQLISPENQRNDDAWRKANQELIDNAEGEAFLYPQYRSLYISCHEAKSPLKQSSLKILSIDGVEAYEVSSTGIAGDGSTTTTYAILAEKDGVAYEILLDHTEYDDLSDTVKRIIQSISFEE